MSCNLPAMIYSAPLDEDIVNLDFDGVVNPNAVTRTTKRNLKRRRKKSVEQPYSQWNALPDIILEDIFARLTIRDRYYASQVCQNWNRMFYSPRVWNTFILEDRTLTRRKFNYYMGYQHVLDHHRTQICLHRMGRGFRRLVITPMENFFNLYEFMTIVSYFCEFFEDQPLSLVRTLDFTFGCDYAAETAGSVEDKVFGTGGKLLEALKRMVGNLTGLRNLSLQDLLLEKEEAKYLLDDVAYNCCETLRSLRLVNCTKEPYAMLHAGVFINLRTLTISPQHLSEDIVTLLGFTRLQHLYLLQTRNVDGIVAVSSTAWKKLGKDAPSLQVHHQVEGKIRAPIVWQEGAPIRSVIYDTPYSQVCISSVLSISSFYCRTLQVYAHMGLPRFYMPRSFGERADTALMLLSRSCPNLNTLAIRERVSTATILLLAHHSRNLRRLAVRRNAMVKKCEWPHNPEWSDSFYDWLRTTSRSYESTTSEVSRLLGSRWSPLTDKEFKSFRL